jgi:hypothetical protein
MSFLPLTGGGGFTQVLYMTKDPEALSFIIYSLPWDQSLKGSAFRAQTTPINFELSQTNKRHIRLACTTAAKDARNVQLISLCVCSLPSPFVFSFRYPSIPRGDDMATVWGNAYVAKNNPAAPNQILGEFVGSERGEERRGEERRGEADWRGIKRAGALVGMTADSLTLFFFFWCAFSDLRVRCPELRPEDAGVSPHCRPPLIVVHGRCHGASFSLRSPFLGLSWAHGFGVLLERALSIWTWPNLEWQSHISFQRCSAGTNLTHLSLFRAHLVIGTDLLSSVDVCVAQSIYPIPTWEERVFAPSSYSSLTHNAESYDNVIFAGSAVGLLACCVTMAFIAQARKAAVIRAATPWFCAVTVLGCISTLLSNYGMHSLLTPSKCQAQVWLLTIGQNSCTVAAVGAYRHREGSRCIPLTLSENPLYSDLRPLCCRRIFDVTKLSVLKFSVSDLFALLSGLLLVDVIINVIWSATVGITTVLVQPDLLRPGLDYYTCDWGNGSMGFVWTHVCIKGLMLLLGVILAYAVRNVPTAFNEATLLGQRRMEEK